jgi:hypothetical protein
MSVIGSGNVGALGILSSVAGGQRRDVDTNETKAQSAAQKFALDQKAAAAASLDIGQTGESSDRDADGRQAWEMPERPHAGEGDASKESATHRPAPDADGICGRSIDLTA